MTSQFITIYLGKGSGETTNKNGHIFPVRKGVPQFSVVTGKYNNQGIIAFTFLTMHCESLIWFCEHCHPYTPEGTSPPQLKTATDRQPTLLVLKAIRLLNGFQAHVFFYFIPIAINSTFQIPQNDVYHPFFPTDMLCYKAFGNNCFAPSQIVFLEGMSSQRRLIQPCQ